MIAARRTGLAARREVIRWVTGSVLHNATSGVRVASSAARIAMGSVTAEASAIAAVLVIAAESAAVMVLAIAVELAIEVIAVGLAIGAATSVTAVEIAEESAIAAVASAIADRAAAPVAIASAIAASAAVPEVAAVSVAARAASAERARVRAVAAARRAWVAAAAAASAVAVVAVAASVAAAEAVVVVVAAVAVVVAEGGNEVMKQSKAMKSKSLRSLVLFIAVCCVLIVGATAVSAQTAIAVKAKSFPTAQDAANALIDAAEKYDETALNEILGPDSYDIVHTGEPARDREVAKEFAALARAKTSVSAPKNARRAFLLIGDDDWPFPVPIVKVASGWAFDTNAGRREIFLRRIGGNELNAIEICRGYVEAQHEYALIKRGNSGVNQYAQRIISTPGTQDGLAWQNSDGTWGGPIGEKVAAAIARGYSNRAEPYHGYFFKVLKGQGPAAPLGELDFVVKGVMIGGFALVAFPAQYRLSGVQTFMVSHDGVVYQKDLGPDTVKLANEIERFNPDKTWTPVLEQ